MRVLALDSTTRAGSVALLEIDDVGIARIADERAGDQSRTHAERLPADLTDVLAAHQWSPSDVDVFAVASGPGSFTGLRIGIATMQGFALACERPLIGVSALDALAEAAGAHVDRRTVVGAWMDAYRREIFSGLYRVSPQVSGGESLFEIEGPRVGDAIGTLARWAELGAPPSLFIGGGAALYADAIASALPAACIVSAPMIASAVGRIAARRAASGARPHPAALQPLYVRRPDAEVARDKAAQVE